MIKQRMIWLVLFSLLLPFEAMADELFSVVRAKAAKGEMSSIMEMGRRYAKGIDVRKDDEEALKWYNQALAKNYPPAVKFFAEAYYYGDKVDSLKIDYAKAYEYYKKSAALGDVSSAYMAGMIAFNGIGMPQDYAAAKKFFSDACPRDVYACIYLGVMARYGIGMKKDNKLAEQYFSFQNNFSSSAPAKNDGESYFNRGRRFIYKNPEDAVGMLLKAEENGVKEAGVLAKLIIMNDETAYRNSREGVAIIRDEAAKGNVSAMNRLGEIYYEGKLVPERDLNTAKKWFNKAVENGDVLASRNLGLLALNEDEDTVSALRWFLNAGNGGDGVSAYYVGQIYASDERMKNTKNAEEWFMKSARDGEEKSQAIVAMMYVAGSQTVARDYASAYAWFTLAEKGFSGKEKERLHETALLLKTHLDEQDIEKANKIIIEYNN